MIGTRIPAVIGMPATFGGALPYMYMSPPKEAAGIAERIGFPMNCPRCDRTIPADAAFCIYCAALLRPAPASEPRMPATGATIRLSPAKVVAPGRPLPAASQPAQMRGPARRRGHGRHGDPSGMLFLVGLALLIATHSFWPGILILIGLSHYVKQSGRGRGGPALREMIFWGGLALLFATHMFWPGILVLLFVTSLLGQSGFGWRP